MSSVSGQLGWSGGPVQGGLEASMRFARVLLVVALCVETSCVSIATKTEYTEDLVRRRSNVEEIPNSTTYVPRAALDGETLALTFHSEERCKTTVTPVYHKVAHHHHSIADGPQGTVFHPGYTAVYGLVIGATGAYGYADADALASDASSTGSGSTNPADYQNIGLVLMSVGVGLLAIAAIDQYRLSDDEEDLGEVDHEPEVSEDSCHGDVVANEKVILRVDGIDWKAGGITDAHGTVKVGLGELPESAFKSSQLELTATLSEGATPVVLSEKSTSRLLDALAADPQARIARDRDAQKLASCEQQVASAATLQVTVDTGARELQRIEGQWQQARESCGDKWQPSHEEAFTKFHAQVEATAQERANKVCADAVKSAMLDFDGPAEGGMDGGGDYYGPATADPDNPDLKAAIEAVHTSCKDLPNGAKAIASVDDRLNKLRKDLEREKRRNAVFATMQERFQANDAVGLASIVVKDADARAALVSSPQAASLMVGLASFWVGRVEQGSGGSANAQLCATRTLIRVVAGDAEWMKLRKSAVERAGVVNGSRLAKTMDGCK
jgi:hypothetical protein